MQRRHFITAAGALALTSGSALAQTIAADTASPAPLARPGKILALAGNYRAHRAEGGVASPSRSPVAVIVSPDCKASHTSSRYCAPPKSAAEQSRTALSC